MATVADLVRVIADRTNTPAGRVKHLSRRLQEADRLPLSSGAYVPSITVSDVASLLIALASDVQVKDAVQAVATYGDLVMNGIDLSIMPEGIRPVAHNARDYLEHVMHQFVTGAAAECALNARLTIEFVSTWPEIRIYDPADASTLIFREAGADATRWESDAIRKSVTVTGRAIARIIRDLRLTR